MCPDCNGKGFFRLDVPVDDPRFGKLIKCENPIHAPERIARLAKVSDLHEVDENRRLKDINIVEGNKEMIEAARQIISDPRGWLYLWGGPGNAKSEILIAIVNELNAAGRGPAMYLKFSRLVNWMRDSYSERDYRTKKLREGIGPDDWQIIGYIDRFDRIKEIKILAIDELDKIRSTEFSLEFQFDFLDERYRQAINGETVTIFAGQSPPSELRDPLASRIMDGRFRIVENTAGDARPDMAWLPYKDD